MSQRVITFHYRLTDQSGEELDSSEGSNPFAFLEGAKQIIPGLEVELIKLSAGDKTTVKVDAKNAYGDRDERFVLQVGREDLPVDKINVGDELQAGEGELEGQIFSVTEITDESVTLDANHPLAGRDLTFDVEIVEIREATQEEIEHGHIHGEDGVVH